MSVEVTCSACGEEYDARHGACPNCSYRENDSLLAENARLLEALERCVGWMRPVMDGFSIPSTAESRKILEDAERLLLERVVKG
jgi:hypothetical protein